MSVYKIFILLVFKRECMKRNVMTSFRILSLLEYFLRKFQTEWSGFFTLQCELFISCNVSNNAGLVSAWTRGGGRGDQPNVDRPGQGKWVQKISKFVRAPFMDDPKVQKKKIALQNLCQNHNPKTNYSWEQY